MNYDESIEYIHGVDKFGMILGLDSIKELLNRLDNPQDKLDFIHIAGTNGKGSTAAFIANILEYSGYNVGLYTSPYLEVFNERIRMNMANISDEDLAIMTTKVKRIVDEMVKDGYAHPTEFEIVTAISFCYFYEKNVDIVVLEVGLGGRYDATNIINKSIVSVITSISKDHVQILGNSIEEIAYEKAGIIKDNGVTFLYEQEESVMDVVKNVCIEKNNKFIISNFDSIAIEKSNLNNQVYSFRDFMGDKRLDYKIRLLGKHQIKNSVLACNVAIYLMNNSKFTNITEDSIKLGILNTKWGGRLEIISEKPFHIIDGAHNLDSAKVLSKEIDILLQDYDKTLVIGVLKDKDVDGIIKELVPKFDRVIITLPDNPRAMPVEELSYRVGMYVDDIICIEDSKQAVKYAVENIEKIRHGGVENNVSKLKYKEKSKIKKSKNKYDKNCENKKNKFVIISAGSLYLIGNIRRVYNDCK